MRVLELGLTAAALALLVPVGIPAAQDTPPPEAPAAPAQPELFQRGNPGQARMWARVKHKVALIAFYSADCEPCRKLDEGALADPKVRALLAERTEAIKLENDGDPFYTFWRVLAEPTLLFITPDGEELGRVQGVPEPEQMLEQVEAILAETDGLAAAKARVEAAAEDPWAHLVLARALRNRQQTAEALREFLWVLDHTRGKPDWRPQREGEVLREIGVLGQRSKDATLALRERRDQQKALLLEPPAEGEEPASEAERALAARDVRALSSVLGESRAALAVWDELRARPGEPRAVIDELFNVETAAQILQSKRYADLMWAWPDLLVVVEQRMAEIRALRGQAALASRETIAAADLELNRLFGEASGYYEALLGVGREKDAADLAELLIAFEPNVRAYTSLMIGAQRAERLDKAREIYERGLAEIEAPAEKQRLQRVGEGVFARKP
jgi:hypothetical protein